MWRQLVLTRWLGPWARPEAVPDVETTRKEIVLPSGNRALLYLPAGRVHGAYLISIGMHFNGPSDPRLDRFCRVLAAARVMTLVPVLRDYQRLRVGDSVVADLDEGLTALLARKELGAHKPAILSISFGSFPALRIAAARPDDVGALCVFGGYADFSETIRFIITGEVDGRPHGHFDPLNYPVVFINLIDHLPDDERPENTEPLKKAWLDYCKETWGDEEMKSEAPVRNAVARKIAERVPKDQRALFLRGTLTEGDGDEMLLEALTRMKHEADKLDPRPYMKDIRCPTMLVHGIGDDVIPYTQMHELEKHFSADADVTSHLTGLFGHSGASRLIDLLGMVPRATRELWHMQSIVRTLARAGG